MTENATKQSARPTPPSDRLQSCRYEFKYVIDEPTAYKVLHFTKLHIEPDAHTIEREGLGYSVHSLYLDSPDLMTCRATQHGEKNRFKLRIRFYDDSPHSPVFFEIKRRVNLVIMKQRAAVRRSSVPRLLAGDWPQPADLVHDDEKNFAALYNFCSLRNRIGAQPAAYTSYMREGYEPRDSNIVRVTFDRRLRAGTYDGVLSVAGLEKWSRPHVGEVVLELKFTDRFPDWMHELVQWFDLERTSVPKYVECVTLVGRDSSSPRRGRSQRLPIGRLTTNQGRR